MKNPTISTKKPSKKKPKARKPDQSQIALSVVEKAIGGKLADAPTRPRS